MKIFSGNANQKLAIDIAASLSIPLSAQETHVFPDGERRIQLRESVVDEHVILVEPTSPPVDTHFVELLLLIDAAKRSGAKSVTAVVPYLGYQRQDHVFRDGEAVSLDVVRKIIEAVGADKLLIIDGHSSRIEQLFSIPVIHLSALQLFAEKIKTLSSFISDFSSFCLVSPDMGGIRRIKMLSEMLGGMSWVAIEKDRDVTTGSITASVIHGEMQGKKRGIIIDDMISSGKTIVQAANLLEKNGVSDVVVFATHAVFSEKAPLILQESLVSKIYVTNSIAIPEKKQFPKLEVISIANIIASSLLASSV